MSKPRIAILAATLTVALAPAAARATFAGHNGTIAFPMGGGEVDIYATAADGSGLRQLTHAKGFSGCPSYTRDGRTIAFCSDRSGSYQIWTMNADGSQQRQVTRFPYPSLFPAFSRDGRRIFFNADDGGPAANDIYVVGARGGKPARLTGAPGDDEYPAVSPDGRTIAYVSHRDKNVSQLWLMDADGKHQRELTHDALAKDELPDWSPDGKRIAYQAGRDIWIVNADGSHPTNLTGGRGGLAFGARWSPDGTKVAFVERKGPLKQLAVINTDGSGLHLLVHTSAKQLIPAWQPLP